MFILRSGVLLFILVMGSAALLLLASDEECKQYDRDERKCNGVPTSTPFPTDALTATATPTEVQVDPTPTIPDPPPQEPSPTASETPTVVPTQGGVFIVTGFGETPSPIPSVTPTTRGAGGLKTPTITATPTIVETPTETAGPSRLTGTSIPEPTITIDSEKPEGGPEMGWPEATTASVSIIAAAALLWPFAVALAKRADPCGCPEEEKEE